MHGRLKVKSSEEQLKEKAIEKAKKLRKFQLVCADILQSRNNEKNPLLMKTAEVLIANPDIYTFWNIRKEVLLDIKINNSDKAEELLKKELNFLNECLKSNPKSYGSWQHRCFVMNTMNLPDWKAELDLCSKFLEIDDRNFHCWDYRRYIVKKSGEPLESELDFTTCKIAVDFSNFSSWHYRSKILSELHSISEDHIGESVLSYELSLVENAMFTDPNDQSGWFYHRWLLNEKRKFVSIKGVYINHKDVMMLILSSSLQVSDISTEIAIDGMKMKVEWETANGKKCCRLMIAALNAEGTDLRTNNMIELNIEALGHVGCRPVFLNKLEGGFYSSVAGMNECVHPLTQTILKKQYDSLKELHILEPDNKWTLHALMSLMKLLDITDYYKEALNYLNKLMALDPFRINYYRDLVSKLELDKKLRELDGSTTCINLSGMSLLSVPCLDKLCLMKFMNLSDNNLTSLNDAYFLQCIEVLVLHHNNISDCTGIAYLKELVIIDLSYNDIRNVEDLLPLGKCPKLETILIEGNPIKCIPNYEVHIRKCLPNVKMIQ